MSAPVSQEHTETLTVAKRMKRSSIATFRNTIAFIIWRAMNTVMKVPVRAHVAIVTMFDLSVGAAMIVDEWC
jgi:hypothetical protein